MAQKHLERIHIIQVSAQFSDSDSETQEDFTDCFKLDPDVLSFTEMGSQRNLRMLEAECRKRDYHLYRGEAGSGLKGDDCCIAVKQQGREIKFTEGGHVRVHEGQDKPENLGGRYGPKGITWASFNFYGVKVTHHVAHWVHNQTDDTRGINLQRANAVSQMMGRQVALHGRKGAVSFFAGDMNVDPDQKIFPRHIFDQWKLVTIWEDAGQRPTHGNRSIDVVGRYGADARVEFIRFVTHPANSDHRPVSAHYEIQVDNYAPHDNPPSGDPDGEPPIFNAGNRSWKDYTDDEVYNLPIATDDSDNTNG